MHTTLPYLLVVDDDPDIREAVRDVLVDEGYSVRLASNGREALNTLTESERPPCLVLLDLMMPIVSGEQVLEMLKRDGVLARIPVVVLSASRTPTRGNAGLLGKPVDLEALLSMVARYCDKGTGQVHA